MKPVDSSSKIATPNTCTKIAKSIISPDLIAHEAYGEGDRTSPIITMKEGACTSWGSPLVKQCNMALDLTCERRKRQPQSQGYVCQQILDEIWKSTPKERGLWACSQLEERDFDNVIPKTQLWVVILVHIHPDKFSCKDICILARRRLLNIGRCLKWFEPRCCLQKFLDSAVGIVDLDWNLYV